MWLTIEHHKMKQLYILIFLLITSFLSAQNDSINDVNDNIDIKMEDIMSGTETDQDVDFTVITDAIQDWLRKPLNLNNATREDLLLLPGINDILVNKLFDYIANTGELTTVYELQAIDGFTEKIVQGIMPFVTTDARPKDIDPNRMHPAGPRFSEVKKGMTYELIQRLSTTLEKQPGYGPIQYNADGSEKSHYLGSNVRNYTRFRARYNQYFSFALTGEKDAGEKFRFSPKDKLYGYDFLSGHLAISNYGNLKSLVIGDFNLQTGQGLIFSSGLGFGKGTEVITAIKMQQRGIRPYASVNENSYRRGIAISYAIKRVYISAFLSRTPQDGSSSYVAADTLGTDENVFSGFQLGGNHRTPSEFAKRGTLTASSAGGRIEYRNKRFSIGTSHLYHAFSTAIVPKPNAYNQFDFKGKTNIMNGIDFDWVVQNFNFFGEIARSSSGGIAAVGGMIAALSPKVDFALHLRSFDKNFHSLNGYAFGEQPRTLQNERGIYLGLRIRPNTKWTISSFFDRSYFPYQRFTISYPSNAYDFLTQVDYSLRRGTMLTLRFRTHNKEYDSDSVITGQLLNFLVPQRRDQFRMQFQSQLNRAITIRTRAEGSLFQKADAKPFTGFMIYQDLMYKIGFKAKITARYSVFTISDYTARIYTYENEVPGFFSIPALSGTGSRYYIMLNYKIIRGLDLWIRLAQTRYFSPNNGLGNDNYHSPYTIGSGLDEIIGTHRTDVRFQLRYSF